VTQTVSFAIEWRGRQVQAEVGLPDERVPVRFLLPLVQQITDAVTGLAEAAVKDAGREVTCKAGCGACCRQLVPVTRTEAHHLRDLVEAIPEPRRTTVRERFAEALKRLDESGLRSAVEQADRAPDRLALGRDYFRLGIACPFLEEESCSIYADRPLRCREYLVTSPAELCRSDYEGEIRKVLLPAHPMAAFVTLDAESESTRWVALPLAPTWADANPKSDATEPGTELFAKFMSEMNANTEPS
jgi:Fe-S-cluster containining protein